MLGDSDDCGQRNGEVLHGEIVEGIAHVSTLWGPWEKVTFWMEAWILVGGASGVVSTVLRVIGITGEGTPSPRTCSGPLPSIVPRVDSSDRSRLPSASISCRGTSGCFRASS